MLRSLVGSEMCIRDSSYLARRMASYTIDVFPKEQHPSPHQDLSFILMVAPNQSHTERPLFSRHHDRCLYAVLGFIRYAWYRILCVTAVRVRACVSFLSILWSCMVLSASDRRPSLLHTYTQQQTLTPSVFSYLPSVAHTQGHTEVSLFPEGTISELPASIRHVCVVSYIDYTCTRYFI